ncbi:hypothetical protein CRENBAI_008521 [Crenichthys baileyi]|uniref:Uncharacterized protein n=1 Tax=Crenichthys baileyi TaxID=28760 RepID=A0AAV9S7D5_9TELE
MLDHLFAEYWTVYTLLDTTRPFDIIGHFVSSIVRHYKSQCALRLVGRGRPKSDVTRDYIWKAGVLNLAFQLEISTDYHATEASSGEEEVPRGVFIYSPSLATKRTFMTEIPGIRRPEISTLPIEGVSLTRNQKTTEFQGDGSPPCFFVLVDF